MNKLWSTIQREGMVIMLVFVKCFYFTAADCFFFIKNLFTQDKGTGKFIQDILSISEATGRFQEGLSFSSCHLLWPVGFAFCHATEHMETKQGICCGRWPEPQAVVYTADMRGLNSFAQTQTKW